MGAFNLYMVVYRKVYMQIYINLNNFQICFVVICINELWIER